MSEGTPNVGWFQIKLRDVFLATFWIGIACGVAPMAVGQLRGEARAPIWGFVMTFSLLAAFWSLRGRYQSPARWNWNFWVLGLAN
jgi:hypothetical protein